MTADVHLYTAKYKQPRLAVNPGRKEKTMLDHNNFYFIMSHQSFEEWKNNYDYVWETIDDYSERSDAEIIHDVKQIIFERPEDEREFLSTIIRGVHDMNECSKRK